MDFDTISELETQMVFLLNLDNWQLKKCRDKYSIFDAYGYDYNGKKCVMEFKFRQEFYQTKMLEHKKYASLMGLNKYDKKYYCVIDSGGCHVYDLSQIDISDKQKMDLPKKTITDNPEKKQKEIYFLKNDKAIVYNYKFF